MRQSTGSSERILRIIGLSLLTPVLGCVGPKLMSRGMGSHQVWRSHTSYDAKAVGAFPDRPVHCV